MPRKPKQTAAKTSLIDKLNTTGQPVTLTADEVARLKSVFEDQAQSVLKMGHMIDAMSEALRGASMRISRTRHDGNLVFTLEPIPEDENLTIN